MPKYRAVGGKALTGLGIEHILSSVSMVTHAFSHCPCASQIWKMVLLLHKQCFFFFL